MNYCGMSTAYKILLVVFTVKFFPRIRNARFAGNPQQPTLRRDAVITSGYVCIEHAQRGRSIFPRWEILPEEGPAARSRIALCRRGRSVVLNTQQQQKWQISAVQDSQARSLSLPLCFSLPRPSISHPVFLPLVRCAIDSLSLRDAKTTAPMSLYWHLRRRRNSVLKRTSPRQRMLGAEPACPCYTQNSTASAGTHQRVT